jgi:hypothetical protein
MMTLNMTHLIGHALGASTPPRCPDGPPGSPPPSQVLRYAAAIGPFLVGLLLGALSFRAVGFWAVAVPVTGLLALAAAMRRH